MSETDVRTSTPPGFTALLVATDFSETAEAALDWAIEIARPQNASIRLVHGLTVPAPLPDYLPTTHDFGEDLRRAAEARLDEAAERVAEAGVSAEVDLRLGLPSQAILEVATEFDPDLIVVGTRGLTGLAHLLLGSTAERVVQRATAPVLTVHPDDAGRHRPIATIVVPTDFSRDAEQALAVARRFLGRPGGARLVLVHAFHLPVEYTAYGPIPTSVNYLKDVAADAEERLGELAARFRAEGVEVSTVCREGYPPDVIVDVAAAEKADLVAMGTHGRSGLAHLFLGSTAERVVQRSPCPVMTVRRMGE
jgi:nucleotide-binding universal stress UspA family protein